MLRQPPQRSAPQRRPASTRGQRELKKINRALVKSMRAAVKADLSRKGPSGRYLLSITPKHTGLMRRKYQVRTPKAGVVTVGWAVEYGPYVKLGPRDQPAYTFLREYLNDVVLPRLEPKLQQLARAALQEYADVHLAALQSRLKFQSPLFSVSFKAR